MLFEISNDVILITVLAFALRVELKLNKLCARMNLINEKK